MTERKKVSVQGVLGDIKQGLSDKGLMDKYGLSEGQLAVLFRKLIDGGFITQSELNARTPPPIDTPRSETAVPPRISLPPSGAISSGTMAWDEFRPSDEELRGYETKVFWGIVVSLLLNLLGASLGQAGGAAKAFGVLISLICACLYFWSFYFLVKRKGYHWAWTFLGFLSCIGLLIMLFMKDKYELPHSGYITVLRVLAIITIVLVVVGIIASVAIPRYKRTACDNTARQELTRLHSAYESHHGVPL